MESDEVDTALDELEVRLERLRALYEQYFLGFEKLEPSVLRKDVDRRIYLLRRAKIRNTGRRFKLQTIIQRYNTFQQYWQRVCREIENGTYRRHVLRAERNIGPTDLLTAAARRRFGKQRQRVAGSESPPPPEHGSGHAPVIPQEGFAAPSSLPPAASASLSSQPAPSTLPPRAPAPNLSAAAPVGPFSPRSPAGPAAPMSPATPALARSPSVFPEGRRRSEPPSRSNVPASFESLELDMDFMGDWDPAADVAPGPEKPVQAEKRRDPSPSGPSARRLAPPPKPARAADPSTTRAEPKAAAPSRPTPLPARPPAEPRILQEPRGSTLKQPEPRAPEPRAPEPRAPEPKPAPLVQARATSDRERSALEAREAPVQSRQETTTLDKQAPEQPAPERRARPATQEQPLRDVPKRTKPQPEPLSEEKLRDLHARLVQASQSLNKKPTSFESLAKSLKDTEAKLRAQHGNRRIEFEIVVKDGKPAVKPTVR